MVAIFDLDGVPSMRATKLSKQAPSSALLFSSSDGQRIELRRRDGDQGESDLRCLTARGGTEGDQRVYNKILDSRSLSIKTQAHEQLTVKQLTIAPCYTCSFEHLMTSFPLRDLLNHWICLRRRCADKLATS